MIAHLPPVSLQFFRGLCTRRFVGAAVVVGCTALLGNRLNTGWIPHDTGQLGHSAERVLEGQLPHCDFDEPYTGGLTYLNALGFRLFGVRAEAMRWVLAGYFVLLVAAIYYLASRVAPPLAAAGVTVLAASMSVPIYAAGVPSWYNLIFAVLASLTLIQFVESGRPRWLFWAGCCAGCSLLMKITGLYLVAGCLCFFAYREQCESEQCHSECAPHTSRWPSWLVTAVWVLFGLLGLLFMRGDTPVANAAHFALPIAAPAVFLIVNEWRRHHSPFATRARRLLRLVLPFAAGLASLVAVFVLPYIARGGLPDLLQGLLVSPAKRLDHAALLLPTRSGCWRRCPLRRS